MIFICGIKVVIITDIRIRISVRTKESLLLNLAPLIALLFLRYWVQVSNCRLVLQIWRYSILPIFAFVYFTRRPSLNKAPCYQKKIKNMPRNLQKLSKMFYLYNYYHITIGGFHVVSCCMVDKYLKREIFKLFGLTSLIATLKSSTGRTAVT